MPFKFPSIANYKDLLDNSLFPDTAPIDIDVKRYHPAFCGNFSGTVTQDRNITSPGWPLNDYPNSLECTVSVTGTCPEDISVYFFFCVSKDDLSTPFIRIVITYFFSKINLLFPGFMIKLKPSSTSDIQVRCAIAIKLEEPVNRSATSYLLMELRG